MDTTELLRERKQTHGDFVGQAAIEQTLKLSLQARDGWSDLAAHQRSAVEMICVKLARIIAGNPNFKDHWDDIAGYAKLVADRCHDA